MLGVVDNGSKFFPDLTKILDKLKVKYKTVTINQIPKTNMDKFDGLILSGSPLMLAEAKVQRKVLRCYRFLKNYDKPVLGICFGHQLIGFLNGSTLRNLGFAIEGTKRVIVHKEGQIFKGLDKCQMYCNHEEYIVKIPEDFMLLASSDFVDVLAMKHKKKPLFGVQFHPECSDKDGETLIKNFLRLI
ncbi:MAG: gamma-glutamyl-gamma-aminobutyrate hydrolase family protein [archaeon]